jgi:hypothetical protein
VFPAVALATGHGDTHAIQKSTSAAAAAVEASATRVLPPAKYGTSVMPTASHSTDKGGTCTHAAETIKARATSADDAVTSAGPSQTELTLNERVSQDAAAMTKRSSASAPPRTAV